MVFGATGKGMVWKIHSDFNLCYRNGLRRANEGARTREKDYLLWVQEIDLFD